MPQRDVHRAAAAAPPCGWRATVVCAGIALAAHAGAETPPPIEEIVVTGSRIARGALEEPAPLTTLHEEDLGHAGLTNLGHILSRLPVTGAAINTRFNLPGNFGFPQDGTGIGAGAAQVSLRNLGAKRTLVLVDGQRFIAGASASGVPSAVDLNTLPTGVIERIEILHDGASAIYGADAIGGVLNVITRQTFDGIQLTAHTAGDVAHGDGAAADFGALWGGGDAVRFLVGAQWVDEGEIFTSARKLSRFPNPGGRSCEDGGCSTFTPQGRFVLGPALGGADLALNDGASNDGGANLPRFDPADPTGGDFHAFTAADRFNYNGGRFNYLLTPNRRGSAFAHIEAGLAGARLTVRALLNRRESATRGAPEPLCLGNGCGNRILNGIAIAAAQPYNPFGADLSVAAGTLEFFGRRPLESGPRIFEQEVDTRFVTARLDGQFTWAGRSFAWDLNVSHGKNRGRQRKRGAHNAAKLAIALGDPAVCARTPGCVPFNFFGGQGADGRGSITPAMLDFVGFVQRDASRQTLGHVSLHVTGEVATAPAGAVEFAAGVERREQDGWFRPDPIARRGETAGIAAAGTRGGLDVTALHAEISVPVLAGVPGAELLTFNVAARGEAHGDGPEPTWKLGALWRPAAWLAVRATASTGIRAAGIGELFGGAAREDFVHLDPCADTAGVIGAANGGRDAPQPPHIVANCLALGAPRHFAQRHPQLAAVSAGNRDLTPETSRSLLLGWVLRPARLQASRLSHALTLSVDYHRTEILDAIQGRSPAEVVDACVQGLRPEHCSLVRRDSSGHIEIVDNPLANIGGIETSGVDIALDYQAPPGRAGEFRLRLDATHLADYVEWTRAADGSKAAVDYTGMITSETFQRAFPRWRATARLDWRRGDWGAGLALRHVARLKEPSGAKLGSRLYADVRLERSGLWGGRLAAALGFNNLFNEAPPVCMVCGLVSFSAVAHDLPGVFGYFRMALALTPR